MVRSLIMRQNAQHVISGLRMNRGRLLVEPPAQQPMIRLVRDYLEAIS